jgi:hypothetical protein
MKKTIIFFCLCLPLFCMAQLNPLARTYEYDAAGNRTLRKVLDMSPQPSPPSAPQDSVFVTSDERDSRDPLPQTAYLSPQTDRWLSEAETTTNFYVEKIAQVEIKIYPNPTTEKITFEIAGWVETHCNASLQLFTMNGQLLQNHPVHSVTTEVSLAGLAKGAYILKVQINDRTEDWKIIKQ